ncbi:apyrase 6 isoform X1 [Tripterygium wilfordii]|uniref:Apyrase 6 isoform X1 n=1 Tax=Tripterygium wilfordii TaxID=458696 RepID=A0A7J7E0D2_TRIWF|nr:probable apyrase 6 [Tripterygium wilfordii]KAF5751989.1 apyrase 6 isoform X1 [Tripterygium wilfordii]
MRRLHARNRVNSKPNESPNSAMDPLKLTRSTNFFWISKNSKPTSSRFRIIALIAIALVLVSCYCLFVVGSSRHSKRYGIIIDGGSTGTRIHVFGYRMEKGNAVFDADLGTMKVNPGLSAYAEDPNGAAAALKEIVEFGKGKVPREQWAETEIRLMATAGMRLLTGSVQERILESCRRVLRASGFKFKDDWATVITGSDEGLYAWVVANYAMGTLGGDPLQTTGIIELGGASMQVTFVSSEPIPSEFLRTVRFGNFNYNVYSHSFLHFGQNVAFESLRKSLVLKDFDSATEPLRAGISLDPCTPKGYSNNLESWRPSPDSLAGRKESLPSLLQSSGNFTECRSAALMLLQKDKEKCSYQRCQIGSTFIPELRGKFLATENFFYTSEFLGLGSSSCISDILMAGQKFCREDWSKLKKKHNSLNEEDLAHYCFSSAYIVAMLHDSLGIALDDERIGFANQVGSIPLDWALGAFILQSTADLDVEQPDWIATITSEDSPTLLSLIAILVILMFVAWSVSKWRKPQLKTVYDLEKGRYIVTRMNRC